MESTKKVITQEHKAKYLSGGGVRCPFCDAWEIYGGSFECEAEIAWQDITCNVCEQRWQDIYHLTDIDNEFS